MVSARLGSDKYKIDTSLVLLDWNPNPRSPTRDTSFDDDDDDDDHHHHHHHQQQQHHRPHRMFFIIASLYLSSTSVAIHWCYLGL